jgi:alpha-glucosidase
MPGLAGVLIMLRWAGISQILKILDYTLARDRFDRTYRRRKPPTRDAPLTPGRLLKSDAFPSGARFEFENAHLEVLFLAPDLARISWTPGDPPIPYALARTDWPEVATRLGKYSEGWRLSEPKMQILVMQNGELQFLDANSIMLRHDLPPERRGEKQAPSWTSLSRVHPQEGIYGLGEQAGRLNLSGSSYTMWNTDPGGSYSEWANPIYMPMPVYMSLHQDGSYLVFYENSFPATFTFAPPSGQGAKDGRISTATFEGGMLRYYLAAGPPQLALERFTELTGRPGLPPLWSLGYHQSRWGYRSSEDIRSVLAGFKQHELPLSAIHLDIDYMDGYRVFTVDKQRFSDLSELSQELSQQGVRLVAILDPGVKQDRGYFMYQQGMEEDIFCKAPDGKVMLGVVWPGKAAYPDFTNPTARRWWGTYYRNLLDSGISGFWHDMNEPTSFTAWGGQALPLATRHDLEGAEGDHQQAHNLYALQMNRAGFEALRADEPERRPWIISRSGWVSQQRYAWKWSGDTESSWSSLRVTIANALGMGLSGLPYTGPDIGGFSGNPSAELYLRWFQLATFMPFLRTHSAIGTSRREPWVYGEPYTSIIREFLRLRYRLLPYLYTLAWQASQKGYPLVRPLWWIDLANKDLRDIDDAFLLGDDLLIAPILEEGENRRRIVLPQGGWYDIWDGDPVQGPGSVELQAPLECIPILARGGSVLPMAEAQQLFLHIYPASARKDLPIPQDLPVSLLFSDAGDGYGEWRLDQFQLTQEDKTLEIDWRSEGSYPFAYTQVNVVLHGVQVQAAQIDGQAIQIVDNQFQTGVFRHILFEV